MPFKCRGCGVTVAEGHKCDDGKLEWDLFPFDAAEGIVRVLMYGKNKYAAHQWRSGGGIGVSRAITALLRHVFAWLKGEDLDPESGLHHLHHAGCELLFALDSLQRGNKGDTRWSEPRTAAELAQARYPQAGNELLNAMFPSGQIIPLIKNYP